MATVLIIFSHVHFPIYNFSNLKHDAALSVSIGGATGAFVGTDAAYLNGEGNFLKSAVGVYSTDSALTSCVKAGSSTAIGFVASQSVQNVTYKKGANWTD